MKSFRQRLRKLVRDLLWEDVPQHRRVKVRRTKQQLFAELDKLFS